jgi:hypothetical protein
MTARRWATRMGLDSPISVVSILRGKRELRLKELKPILKGLELSLEETRYLQTMVMWKRAKDPEEQALLKYFMDSLANEYSRISGK